MTTLQPEIRRPSPLAALVKSKVTLMLLIGLLGQVAIIAAFTSAMSTPTLHDAEVGLVVSDQARPGVLAHETHGALSFEPFASASDARSAVRAGRLPAAIVLDPTKATLIVASASGASLAASIEQAVTPALERAKVPVTVVDARPLPRSDPHGLGTFLLVIGWAIGGYLGVVLLSRVRRGAFSSPTATLGTFGYLAVYAVASASAGVLVSSAILGVLAGNAWSLILIGSLVCFAISAFTAALLAVFGSFGIIIAIVCLVILGNPTSGGSVPNQMLSGGWQVLAEILPTNAALRAVRAISYFDGAGIGQPVLVLSIYAGAAIVFALLVGYARPRILAKHLAASTRAETSAAPTPPAAATERPAHAHVRIDDPQPDEYRRHVGAAGTNRLSLDAGSTP